MLTHYNLGFSLDSNAPLGLVFSLCDGYRSKLPLSVLLHLLNLLTNCDMPGSGFLFLFALLSKLVILNVTINRISELVKLVQLSDWTSSHKL
jgi:hypothetical protein